jgi:hypothetical protein
VAAAAAAGTARQVLLPGYGYINLIGSSTQIMLPGYGYIDGV